MIAGGSEEFLMDSVKTRKSTESKALVRSRATATVLLGGFFSLNPFAVDVDSWSKAETVEWPGRNPCW